MEHEIERQTKLPPTKQELAIAAFEEAAEKCEGLALAINMPSAKRMFVLADAMNQLDSALTPEVMAPIMKLMGSRVGFKTDKDKNKDGSKGPGYPVATVKEVVKEAILSGAYMTGNEVNIIASGMYVTKEHFMRKVRELPGLTDLEVTIGTPQIAHGEAKVRCAAKWKMNGVEQTIGHDEKQPCTFLIRVFEGSGVAADMAIGKATRKFYKRIYEMATGSELTIPDSDASEARQVDARIVERASMNISDITPGDPAAHTPVDKPQPKPKKTTESILGNGDKKRRDEAYSYLSAAYDNYADEIDDMLVERCNLGLREIPKDTKSLELIAALGAVAKKIQEGK